MSVFIGVFPKGKEEDSPIPGSTDVTIQDSSASFQFEPTGESPAQVLVIPSRSRKGHHPGISAFTTKLFGSGDSKCFSDFILLVPKFNKIID